MIILGVDTALRTTGYGVVRLDGRQYRALDCGTIHNPASLSQSACLRRLGQGVRQLVEQFRPDVAAIEGGFFFRNAKTAMVLGMARGVVVGLLAECAVPVYEYAPRKARKMVMGHGGTDKQQVAAFMAQMLGLDVGQIPDDATDALAIAVCHGLSTETADGAYLGEPL